MRLLPRPEVKRNVDVGALSSGLGSRPAAEPCERAAPTARRPPRPRGSVPAASAPPPPAAAASSLCPALRAGGSATAGAEVVRAAGEPSPLPPKVTGTDARTPGSYTALACAGPHARGSKGHAEILVPLGSPTPPSPGRPRPGKRPARFPRRTSTIASKPEEADPRHEEYMEVGRCGVRRLAYQMQKYLVRINIYIPLTYSRLPGVTFFYVLHPLSLPLLHSVLEFCTNTYELFFEGKIRERGRRRRKTG
ncbi:translation initiation factor IF-2-like [Falco peregrinus]|uniref:translation initiation factor IF-2-like n=1 Tax=Falco peregrinus TaxID=8954 RepID=UPI002478F36D|nr:translation initiation factor IF-2-like [Falco peregrinus]